MRFLKSILVVTFLAFALPSFATDYECKRFDSKCVKAKKKAEFTQSYFRIMDAGVKADWDPKVVRESFSKEEQRALKKIGFDVTSRNLVRTLEKKYQETFSDLDPNAWQSVLDSILHADYVAKQVKYKLMNVAVVERLRNELENSGKKTVKAKSGNFSTRSSSRPAVVVLEDMRRAQSALMKELSKAGDELDIDVLADALEKTTIILVERNEKVTKALRNPKELEKILLKAGDSSGVAPTAILQQMRVAAAPAIEIVNKAAQGQLANSQQADQTASKQIAAYEDASVGELVVIVASMGGDDIPALPTDLSGFSMQDLREIYTDATDEDYIKIMRDYARHAKLQETSAIVADVRWEKNQPGILYRDALQTIWDEGYKGNAAKALMGKMNDETAELWAMVKEVEARTKTGQLAFDQEVEEEKKNLAATGKEGGSDTEEGFLEDAHFVDATVIENTLRLMHSSVHAAVLFDNNQLTYIRTVLDDAYKFLANSRGGVTTLEFKKELDALAADSKARLDKDLLIAEQSAAGDTAALEANDAYTALAQLSVVKQMVADFPDPEGDGITPHEVETLYGYHTLNNIFSAIDAFDDMLDSDNIDKDLALQALSLFDDTFKVLIGSESNSQHWQDQLNEFKGLIDASSDLKSYDEIMTARFAAEDAASAANMAELADEIAKIQDEIDNIQAEYDKAISMGASAAEATAYMQDQEAQRRAGMAELCAAGDANAC